jgi:hypothetical protein
MNLINCNFYSLRTHNNPKLLYFNYTTQPLYKRLSYYKSRYKRYINNHDNYIIAFEIIKYKDVYIELEQQIQIDKDGKNKDVLNGILNKYIRENDCINKNKIQYEDNNIDIKNIKNDNNIIDTNNTENIIDTNTENNIINNKSSIVNKKSNNSKTYKNYQNNIQDNTTKKVLSFVDDFIDNSNNYTFEKSIAKNDDIIDNNNINDKPSDIIDDNNDNIKDTNDIPSNIIDNNDDIKDTNDISSNIIDNNDDIKDTNDIEPVNNDNLIVDNTDNTDNNKSYHKQNFIKNNFKVFDDFYKELNKNKDNKIDDNTTLKLKDKNNVLRDKYDDILKKKSLIRQKIHNYNKTKKCIYNDNIDELFNVKNSNKTLKVKKLQ